MKTIVIDPNAQKEKDDLVDTFIAIFEKVGYTEEVSKQCEKECGSKKVSDCLVHFLKKNGFIVPNILK